MAWAFSLTRKEIKKKFKCSLEELQKRPDIRTTPSIDPNKAYHHRACGGLAFPRTE